MEITPGQKEGEDRVTAANRDLQIFAKTLSTKPWSLHRSAAVEQ